MLQKKVNLFGLKIDDISLARATELARASVFGGDRRIFFTPNLEMLEGARKSEETKMILNSASVLLPDGAGVLLVSRFFGTPIENKVTGVDFGENLIELCEKEEKSVFLLGGAKGIAKKAAKKLLLKHPKLKIVGLHNGYFCDENEVVKKIQATKPDVLIVCMGFPKQEKFIFKHKDDMPFVSVIACLGGAIDIWAGKKKRAPKVVQRIYCEWFFRILQDPRRIYRFTSSLPALFHAMWN